MGNEIIVIFGLLIFEPKASLALRAPWDGPYAPQRSHSDIQREIMDNTTDVRRGAEDFKRNIESDDASS